MPSFNFVVDRVYKVTAAFSAHPDVGLMAEPFQVEAGTTVVYRGSIEIGGTVRHYFILDDDRKAYTRDRTSFENALNEDYDALLKV